MLSVNYAECLKQAHYPECRYAECRGVYKELVIMPPGFIISDEEKKIL
jgi:hypothetical protein